MSRDPRRISRMSRYKKGVLLPIFLLVGGCGKESTDELIEKLKSPERLTRIKAVRTLSQRQEEAARVVPALTEALKDEDGEVRRGAAFGLGSFGKQATEAVPALRTALHDPEARVRKAAAEALK